VTDRPFHVREAAPAPDDRPATGLILSGGLALGAYQLGAFAALSEAGRFAFTSVVGSSIGAINGAIIAGNRPADRIDHIHAFWNELAGASRLVDWGDPLGLAQQGAPRHIRNWWSVASARLTGAMPLFRPRLPGERGTAGVPSLYDAGRTRETLGRYVDFDRLNDGAVRFACATTDILTGECVIFDTARGDRIVPDHLLASGSLLPGFDPVEIDGRLLGDGGFTANAPLEILLASDRIGPPIALCFVLDLFSPDGRLPQSVIEAAERATDLKYGCQTDMRLAALVRERGLEHELGDGGEGTRLFYLSYRAASEEAGPEKPYDFSARSIADRAGTGAADVRAALELLDQQHGAVQGLRVHRIRR
jgi:NTE family protein